MGPERRVESKCRELVKSLKGRLVKLEGEKGDPDRMCILPGSVIFFCEFKRPGAKPTRLQALRLEEFKKAGFVAGWADSVESFQGLCALALVSARVKTPSFEGLYPDQADVGNEGSPR